MNNLNYLNKRQIIPLFVVKDSRGFEKLIGNNQQLITNMLLEKGYYFVSLEQLYYETMSFSIPGIIESLEPKVFRERLNSDLNTSLPNTPGSYLLYFDNNGYPKFFTFQSKTRWGAKKELLNYCSNLPIAPKQEKNVSLIDSYKQIVGVYKEPENHQVEQGIDIKETHDEYETTKRVLMSIIRPRCKESIYNYDRIISSLLIKLKDAHVYPYNNVEDVMEIIIKKLKQDYYDPSIDYKKIDEVLWSRTHYESRMIYDDVPDGVRINPAIGRSAYENPLYIVGKKKPNPEQILKQEPIIKIIFSLEQKLNEFGFDGNEIVNLLPPIINRMKTEIA